MQRKSFWDLECPIARSLDQLGDGWTLLIVRNALLGARRFQDFEQGLAIPPTTLARRLTTLVAHGLLVQRRYPGKPAREEYALTPKGLDLVPVLLAFGAWGNRWLAPDGTSIECVDPRTGRAVDPVLVDRRTREKLVAGRVALRPGPKASRSLRKALHPHRVFGAKRREERAA